MSKILEILAKARANRLQTVRGIVKTYGGDEELDLLPLSMQEDTLFLCEGSLLAHYCEQRLRMQGSEDALRAAFQSSKRMVCKDCGKLMMRCKCDSGNIFARIMEAL